MTRARARNSWLVLLAGPLLVTAAEPPPLPTDTLAVEIDLEWIPIGLSTRPAAPADNPLTLAKVKLGRRLFFDPILSGDRTVACASCHKPDHAFASAEVRAIGAKGQKGRRNAPTLLNVGYGTRFFWDGRAVSLEEQALLPIQNPKELNSSLDEAVGRLKAEPTYATQFKEAFGREGVIDTRNLARALASFERSLVAGDNGIDRFRVGQITQLSESAKQGLWLFESRGGCWRCHSGTNLTDGRFHNTGVGWGGAPADLGRFEVTQRPEDRGAFKTPTLRNVARTAPYMHDGSLKTLEEVVRFYGRGGNANPHLDPAMKPLNFSEHDVKDVVAFLQALTSVADDKKAPPSRGD